MRSLLKQLQLIYVFFTVIGGAASWTEDRVPSAPENVIVKTGPTSATLWWERPYNSEEVVVRGYTVSYGIGTPTRKIIIEGAQSNSFTIDRLKPDTEYVFAVNAYNEADEEDGERVLLTARTQTTQGSQSTHSLWPPIGVRGWIEGSGVHVKWDDPNAESQEQNDIHTTAHRHYIVQYGVYQSENLKKIRSNKKSLVLRDLLPGREYEIAVKVVDGSGRESPWSIRDIVLTPQDMQSDVSRYDWACSFEKDLCGMRTVGDSSEWKRTLATTPTAHEGSYVFSLDPPPSTSKTSSIVTPTFHMQTSNNLCLQFSFFIKKSHKGTIMVLLEDERTFVSRVVFKGDTQHLPTDKWTEVKLNVGREKTTFRVIFSLKWSRNGPWIALDSLSLSSGVCTNTKHDFRLKPYTDQESEVDLLVPVESALNNDEKVFRAKGIDGLPAIGIQRGVDIATPYRLYLPRKFFREFAILAAVKPADRRGGYLFAVVNPFDTVVDIGLLLEPAAQGYTNISLVYSNSRTDPSSTALASFVVPEFVNEWAQFALEVVKDEVILYFKCVRFSAKQAIRVPEQLIMDDAHKLYIGGAGPIIKTAFEET